MWSHRIHRLVVFCAGLRSFPTDRLVAIVREQRHTPLLRCAALRALVAQAPPQVTRGAPYAQRRRSVRRHYGV